MTKLFETVSYDTDVNACYIKMADGEITDTIETQTDCWVDVDSFGNQLGIEILNADQHYNLINKILLTKMPVAECVLS
jgi:uncharacterized protein YuzE